MNPQKIEEFAQKYNWISFPKIPGSKDKRIKFYRWIGYGFSIFFLIMIVGLIILYFVY
jgi:hypothetical protein